MYILLKIATDGYSQELQKDARFSGNFCGTSSLERKMMLKMSLCLSTMNVYGEVKLQIHTFLFPALDVGE